MIDCNMLRIALIGCGEHGSSTLLPLLHDLDSVEPVAVCDLEGSKAERAARRYRLPHWSTDYRKLMDDRQLDLQAVVLACGPDDHERMIDDAIDRGLHVFVEKPPGRSQAVIQRLGQFALDRHITTQVGHNFRYSDACKEFSAHWASPDYGRPLLVEAHYYSSWPTIPRWGLPSVFESFVLTHLVHILDLLVHLLGVPTVRGCHVTRSDRDACALTTDLVWAPGIIGILTATTAAPHFDFGVRIVTDSGAIMQLEGLRRVRVLSAGENRKRWSTLWERGSFAGGPRDNGYLAELKAFCEAVNEKRAAVPSLADEVCIYQLVEDMKALAPGTNF